jgi:hypothetical protein
MPSRRGPDGTGTSVISVRDPGCGRAPRELAQLARSGGDPQLLEAGARQAAAEP